MITLLENIRLSLELRELVLDASGVTTSISDTIGIPEWHLDFRIPVIGKLSLYEAVLSAYINDEIEFGRICCDKCYAVTLHDGALQGDAIVNAIRGEIAIRENVKTHYPALYKAYTDKMLESLELIKSFLSLLDKDKEVTLDSVKGLMDDEINEQLNYFPIQSITDTEGLGLELAACAIALYKEEVSNAN